MSTPALRIRGLRKAFPKVIAVDGVDLEVARGEVFGLLGPNGAGKTTTLEIIEGLTEADSGEIEILGLTWENHGQEIRSRIGVQLQSTSLFNKITPREALDLYGSYYPKRRNTSELLALVQLEEKADAYHITLSGGQQQRLALALALVNDPEMVFLDEPTTGLDPVSRRDVWREVRRLNRELGITIFLTTQYLEEADELADTVAIIVGGKIVTEGSPAKLKAAMGEESINLVFETPELAEKGRSTLAQMGDRFQLDRDMLRLYLSRAAESIPAVINQLQKVGLAPVSLTLTQPTLDDVFLQVTGQRLVASEATKSKSSRSKRREEVN